MIRLLALAALIVFLASPASAACILSHCQKDKAPTRAYITNTHRQIVGDLYSPGGGQRVRTKRLQLRDRRPSR